MFELKLYLLAPRTREKKKKLHGKQEKAVSPQSKVALCLLVSLGRDVF